jgi:hypothetical protein
LIDLRSQCNNRIDIGDYTARHRHIKPDYGLIFSEQVDFFDFGKQIYILVPDEIESQQAV